MKFRFLGGNTPVYQTEHPLARTRFVDPKSLMLTAPKLYLLSIVIFSGFQTFGSPMSLVVNQNILAKSKPKTLDSKW